MVEAAPHLAALDGGVAITHQTGERDLELVRDAYRRAGIDARVEPFLFSMDREVKAADLIVCRAGATTLAELAAAGRASLLVPLPTAADDHQRKNAAVMRDAGASELDRAEGPDRLVAGAADCGVPRRPGTGASDGLVGAPVREAERGRDDRRPGARAGGAVSRC